MSSVQIPRKLRAKSVLEDSFVSLEPLDFGLDMKGLKGKSVDDLHAAPRYDTPILESNPLATVGIGGIVTSTLLTLIVLPTLYEIIEERFGRQEGRGVA